MCDEAFPTLTAGEVERVCCFGEVQQLSCGTVLFAPGERTIDFFLVLDGSIDAYVSRGTAQQVVHVYGQQQFTGELNLFNNRATLVGGRMGCDGRVARLNGAQFRRLLAAEPDIANVVMRAFIWRWVGHKLRRMGVERRIVGRPWAETGWDSLTDAELKVVNLIAQGATKGAVADQRRLSPHTLSAPT